MATRKHEASGIEAQAEPGSRGRVLRNLLGIRRVRDMNEAESQALLLVQDAALDCYGPEHRFTADDVCALHRMWLAPICEWAGRYRSVNVGKSGLQFAHAPLIPRLMADFERGPLARLLVLLMALQAGLSPLDFGSLAGSGHRAYIAGIHTAVSGDYGPLAAIFRRVIERSRRRAASNVR